MITISDFFVRESSRRQIADFVNYPGDYRSTSIWRPEDTPQNLEITE